MSKWISIVTLSAALAVCGCKNHDKDMDKDSHSLSFSSSRLRMTRRETTMSILKAPIASSTLATETVPVQEARVADFSIVWPDFERFCLKFCLCFVIATRSRVNWHVGVDSSPFPFVKLRNVKFQI